MRGDKLDTKAIRQTYHRHTEDEPYGYHPGDKEREPDQIGHVVLDTVNSLCDALDDARAVLNELNKLRSNVVATQSASWSNQMYPFVAMLDRAGLEVDRDPSPEDRAAHLLCYGGAGGSPDHCLPDMTHGSLYRKRLEECRERPSVLAKSAGQELVTSEKPS